MRNFDIKRFSRTMIWNMKVSRRELLTNTLSMMFVFMMFFAISILEHPYSRSEIRESGLFSAVSLSMTVMIILFTVAGCSIFKNMKTKPQRITFMMLPASSLEKFIVRYLYILVLYVVGTFVAYCCADLLRILICEISGIEWFKISIFHLFELLFSKIGQAYEELPVTVSVAIFVHILWVHSTYVLGGVFFSRKWFALTSLAHLVLGIAVIWILSTIHGNVSVSFSESDMEVVAGVYDVVMLGLSVFNFWYSFRLFKRMQIINNKWINL